MGNKPNYGWLTLNIRCVKLALPGIDFHVKIRRNIRKNVTKDKINKLQKRYIYVKCCFFMDIQPGNGTGRYCSMPVTPPFTAAKEGSAIVFLSALDRHTGEYWV